MSGQGPKHIPRLRRPELHRLIVRTRNDVLAIRAKRHTCDRIRVSGQGPKHIPRLRRPELHGIIARTRNDVLAIRAKRHTFDTIRVYKHCALTEIDVCQVCVGKVGVIQARGRKIRLHQTRVRQISVREYGAAEASKKLCTRTGRFAATARRDHRFRPQRCMRKVAVIKNNACRVEDCNGVGGRHGTCGILARHVQSRRLDNVPQRAGGRLLYLVH